MKKASTNSEFSCTTTSFCAINNGEIIVDDKTVFKHQPEDFFKEAYTAFNIDYPKYFKMDELSKLCLLTAELLLRNNPIQHIAAEKKSVVIHNRNSSIISDIKFNESIHNIPSPAHFVYTLPNVMIGELCIRNHIKGENHCFVSESYDWEFQFDWIKNILLRGAEVCIHGWVDFGLKGYSSLLFLTKKEMPGIENISEPINVNQIIQRHARAY